MSTNDSLLGVTLDCVVFAQNDHRGGYFAECIYQGTTVTLQSIGLNLRAKQGSTGSALEYQLHALLKLYPAMGPKE